jgi:hypothetical protein
MGYLVRGECAWLLASVRNPHIPRLELDVVVTETEFGVQCLSQDESVDGAVGEPGPRERPVHGQAPANRDGQY